MKISKQARRDAKHLFVTCRTNALLDEAKVRIAVQAVVAQKPRGYVAILSHFQRLVKLTHALAPLHHSGFVTCEPCDIPVSKRHLDMLFAHMTLTDYARFIRLFLTDGGGLLTPETVAHLTTAQPGAGYALGWGVTAGQAWARGPQLAHEGSNTMWHMLALVAPKRGVAVIGAANAMMPDGKSAPRLLALQLRDRFAPT